VTGFLFSGRIYFLLAMPSLSAKWLNRRTIVSVSQSNTHHKAEVHCVLSASETFIETISIKPISAQPWLNELVIKTQLLTAKDPEEKRVKSRSCMERDRLIELRDAISRFLDETHAVHEPHDLQFNPASNRNAMG
jgi:DUF1009 family protein